ncbi:MAG TPA: histidine kinase dimerization/phosphoacceptor domain -containing protein [Nitrospinota bacterium]|nr:histidine kinase dimerization/phosphoacceptor domain -containing protein [Nitrospinota bacterium]
MRDSKEIPIPLPRLGLYFLALVVVWSLIMSLSLYLNVISIKGDALKAARIQAQETLKKDITYRLWNSIHCGVYVPVTEETEPNPYLSSHPERDITTPSGKKLTLMNPAYMTRQVHELGSKKYGILGHITSLNPIRPANVPDSWEAKAIKAFERGKIEFCSVAEINGKPHMRYMLPLLTDKACLQCHAKQGYKEGDVRGGISVSIPMEPLWNIERKRIIKLTWGHVLLWITGMFGILLVMNRIKRSEKKRVRAEHQIQKSLKEKELLLREIHHRVRSNMQIISSILKLQTLSSKNKEIADVFNKCQTRIESMALVHFMLYQTEDLSEINFKDYIEDLSKALFDSYKKNKQKISLNINVKNVFLDIDTAIPVGIILNELITNSLKHAFKEEEKEGEISISLSEVDEERLELIVKDNGIGLPEDFDLKKTDTLGLQLVNLLGEDQINGEVKIIRDGGTEFQIVFKRTRFKK